MRSQGLVELSTMSNGSTNYLSSSPEPLIFACAALMFMLLGFDMMGLLVLHTH